MCTYMSAYRKGAGKALFPLSRTEGWADRRKIRKRDADAQIHLQQTIENEKDGQIPKTC